MDCRQCRMALLSAAARDRDEALMKAVADHAAECEGCADLLRETRAMEAALGAVGPESAPPEFTRRVMDRIGPSPAPAHTAWYDRLLGPLRAPAPAFSLRHAAVVGALAAMVASGGFLVGRDALRPAPVEQSHITVATRAEPSSPEKAFFDELVRRHEVVSTMAPVPEDEGMRLVSAY